MICINCTQDWKALHSPAKHKILYCENCQINCTHVEVKAPPRPRRAKTRDKAMSIWERLGE